ncbi:glycoside hydrolase superfamily [Spinellus fusiger]|nr:glycoside hydrolase superfamily [Spinellus fusiger]
MDLDGTWFIDRDTGNTVLFRGVNVGGGTKLPVGIPSHEQRGFWVDYDRGVTFLGRPFPIETADEHLSRLVDWGFNLLRFIVTWEAIEHQGPGIYDKDYLDYVVEILKKCKKHKLKVFIDPHQDTWSRHCGGSGHPGWTHSLVGLNPANFAPTVAALVHNTYPEPASFPKMIWNTNYQRLAAATLFTLFFAGRQYAPLCKINGVHIQDYLQDHYCQAILQVTKRVHDNGLENSVVIGYDSMNEPGQGYVGVPDITQLNKSDLAFNKGLMPTPFQGMRLASGIPTSVEDWTFAWNGPTKQGDVLVDPQGKEAWLSEEALHEAYDVFGWKRDPKWPPGCIWAAHGVWDKTKESVLVKNYFADGLYHNDWIEFIQKYMQTIRSVHNDALLFLQPPVLEVPPLIPITMTRIVYAPHWYDGLTLVKKKWNNYNVDVVNLNRGKYGNGPLRFLRALRVGESSIRQCFVDQLNTIKVEGTQYIGDFPCIIGEIGIPYDMEQSKPSALSKPWSWLMGYFVTKKPPSMQSPDSDQNKAMDANLNAIESNLLSCTLWHYMPDNDSFWGDCWNGEDLSILQLEKSVTDATIEQYPWREEEDPLYGNNVSSQATVTRKSSVSQWNTRSIVALNRPFPQKIAGIPLSLKIISPTLSQPGLCALSYKTRPEHEKLHKTEVYLPKCFYPSLESTGTKVWVSHGSYSTLACFDRYWILLWTVEPDEDLETVYELRVEGVKVPMCD